MDNKITINGIDIKNLGLVPCRGFKEVLLTPPPMKDPVVNNSRLQHGVRVINIEPKKDKRDLTLFFFLKGENKTDYLTKYGRFMSILQQPMITLSVPELNTVYKLVYSSCQQYGDYGQKCGKFALRFTEPNPDDRTAEEYTEQ